MYAHIKNIIDYEYKDTRVKDFTYREIYKKEIYQGYTVFYPTHKKNNCARLLSFFFNRFEKYIKNIDDFNKFIDNLDNNLAILNQVTDNLNWCFNNKPSGNSFKNINKEVFFKTNKIKDHYFIIEKMFIVDVDNLLLKEATKDIVMNTINEFNLCGYPFKYDIENMQVIPNLYCSIWK